MSKHFFIIGRNGQLGKALVKKYPDATTVVRQELDISDIDQLRRIDWSKYDVIINAAAYVNADESETDKKRSMTWQANAVGPTNLAKIAIDHKIHLIHISSDYVFDGDTMNHSEDEPFAPLSVYGQSKAAGDIAVSLVPRHHILRTSWVIGDGHNFIRTMKKLADMRINPRVVDDQFGRPTFTSEIVRAIDHIVKTGATYGTYNVSNSGKTISWAELAADTFELAGHDRRRVEFISTREYARTKHPFAARPVHSDLDLSKIQSTGFKSHEYTLLLEEYVRSLD